MDAIEGNSLEYLSTIRDDKGFFAGVKRQFAEIFKSERMSSLLDQEARRVQYFRAK